MAGPARQLPHWCTVYGYVRDWQASGATRHMHDALREQVRVLVGRGQRRLGAAVHGHRLGPVVIIDQHGPRLQRTGDEVLIPKPLPDDDTGLLPRRRVVAGSEWPCRPR